MTPVILQKYIKLEALQQGFRYDTKLHVMSEGVFLLKL